MYNTYIFMTETVNNEQVKEPAKYKFGQSELDYDLYIKNLGNNVQSYIASKNWSDSQRQAFTKAYEDFITGLTGQKTNGTSRLYTDDFGTIFDNEGIIDENNKSYMADSKGNLYANADQISKRRERKNAQAFQAYRELSTYANIIGKALAEKQATATKPTTEVTNTFDLTKHGFHPYWASRINPTGGETDPTPYIDMDPYDSATGRRAQTNRTTYFKQQLEEYLNQLPNYDYSGSVFKDEASYRAAVKDAINGLADGSFDNQDKMNFQRIGILSDVYNTLFSTEQNPNLTAEQRQALAQQAATNAEAEKLKQQADADAAFEADYINKATQQYNTAPIYHRQANPYTLTYGTPKARYTGDTTENGIRNNLAKWYGYEFPDQKTKDGESDEQMQARVGKEATKIYAKFIDTVLANFRKNGGNGSISINGKHTSMAIALELVMHLFDLLEEQGTQVWKQSTKNKQLGSNIWYYDETVPDNQTASVLVWDRNKGTMYYTWAGNIPESNAGAAIQSDYNNQMTARKRPEGAPVSWNDIISEAEGGTLKMQAGGLFANFQSDYGQQNVNEAKRRSSKPFTKVTAEEVRKGNREIGVTPWQKGQTQTAENQEAPTWSWDDYARLAGIGADIVSIFMDPLSGAVAGVLSTAAHTTADVMDDSVSGWQTFKNAVTSLGLDVLALVPGLEGVKIVKELKPWVPKLIKYASYITATAGAAGTVMNSGEIIKSLKKITSDNEHMTVNDWQNIAQLITGITGVARTGKAYNQAKNARKQAAVEDQVGVGIVRGNGKKEDIILSGEHADAMRKFKKDNNIDGANEYLQKLEGFSDATVGTVFKRPRIPDHKPYTFKEKNRPDGWENGWVPGSEFAKRDLDLFNILDPNALRVRRPNADTPKDPTKFQQHIVGNEAARAQNATNATHVVTKAKADALQQQQIQEFLNENGLQAARRASNLKTRRARIDNVKKRLDANTQKSTNNTSKLKAEQTKQASLQKEVTRLTGTQTRAANLTRAYDTAISNKQADITKITSNSSNLKKDGTLKASAQRQVDKLTQEIDALRLRRDRVEKTHGSIALNEAQTKANESQTKITNLTNENTQLAVEITRLRQRLAHIQPKQTTWVDASGHTHNSSWATENLRDAVKNKRTLNIVDAAGNPVRKNVALDWEKIMRTAGFLDKPVPAEFAAGLFKLGGNIDRVRFMQPGGTTPETTVKPDWDKILAEHAAQNHYTEFNGTLPTFSLEYTQKGNRDWVNYANATKDSWATDAAFKELGDQANQYFDDNGNLKGDQIEQFTQKLYATNAYRNFTRHLKQKDANGKYSNAINYFTSIANSESAPKAAQAYATKQLGILNNTSDVTDAQWKDILHARFDNKPGTYHYTPDVNVLFHNYLYNNGNFVEQDKDFKSENYTQYKDQYTWVDNEGITHVGTYYHDTDSNPVVETGKDTPDEKETPGTSNEVKKTLGMAPINPENPPAEKTKLQTILESFHGVPTTSLDAARVMWLNAKNQRLADIKIKEERPLLQDPYESQRPIYGNLRAAQEGNSAAARLHQIAQIPVSSDAQLARATQLSAASQGNSYIEAGNAKDDDMIRATTKESIEAEDKNMQKRHEVAMQNRLQLREIAHNINDVKHAKESENAHNWDLYMQSRIHDLQNRDRKRQTAQEQYDLDILKQDMQMRPEYYATKNNHKPFSNELYQLVKGEKTASELHLDTNTALQQEWKEYMAIMSREAALQRGLSVPSLSVENTVKSWFPNIILSKQGGTLKKSTGTIKKERIREKVKNADRFHDSVKHQRSEHNKKLDRISKSMYGYPKGKIV